MLTPTLEPVRTSTQHLYPVFRSGESEPESISSLILASDGFHYLFCFADARSSSATMMFCTTFLSTPADELGCEGGGGTDRGGRSSPVGVGPGPALVRAGCLSTLHCLVLPQEELYQSLSYRSGGGGGVVGKRMLLEANRTTSCGGEDRGAGGTGARRHRSRSVSPALCRRPMSPARDWFKGIVAKGMWTLQ